MSDLMTSCIMKTGRSISPHIIIVRITMILNQRHIDLLKQNHEETFEKVYHETKASVYAMIFSITRSHPQAEDLMQDVYMKMLIKIDQYRVGTNFKNWLLQIAKHQAIDEYRKKQKVQYVDEHTVDLMSMTQDEAPDQDDLMNHMMEQLNEIEREIVLLKIVDGMSHQDISKIVKKPLGTVLWLYQRALGKLKHYMGEKP